MKTKKPVVVPATVLNVSCTAHLDTGDFEMTKVLSVKIDGPEIVYEMYRPKIPLGGMLEGFTVHLGAALQTRVGVAPTRLNKGDNLTSYQPVTTDTLAYGGRFR